MNLIASGLSGLMLVAEVKPIGRVADIKALYRSSGARYRKGPLNGLSSRCGWKLTRSPKVWTEITAPGTPSFRFRVLRKNSFIELVAALAELSQELSIEPKIRPEHLGDSEDILPMG